MFSKGQFTCKFSSNKVTLTTVNIQDHPMQREGVSILQYYIRTITDINIKKFGQEEGSPGILNSNIFLSCIYSFV